MALPQSNEKVHPMRVCPFGTMVLQVVNTNYGQYNGTSATVIKPVGKYSHIKSLELYFPITERGVKAKFNVSSTK